ncbi:TetR/AcrR family transcriptional regulator, partial [Desulfovibrio sp. OttesenSCG-928-F20]|nr:TetR/AcrR family transcriptional regulator [Desulfovibrio sp. OttesenSCG-928-F20]
MSADRIRQAAMKRFAAQGYDATSLAEVAADVGIKTPSIYAHFAGKEDLFWQLVELSSSRELEKMRGDLGRPEPIGTAMRRYLFGTVERFAAEPHLRFWLRTLYLPPGKMQDRIMACDRQFAEAIDKIVSASLGHPVFGLRRPRLPHETLATAFIGILRAVHAELLYCSSS